MNQEKLQAWFDGEVFDSDLTESEVDWLSNRVSSIVSKIILGRPGVHTFSEHRTIQ
jgi:hypothetical protein